MEAWPTLVMICVIFDAVCNGQELTTTLESGAKQAEQNLRLGTGSDPEIFDSVKRPIVAAIGDPVLPTIIHLSDSTGIYPPNGISNLVEGEHRQYTCQVPDINPAANFSWTVGSLPLTPDGNEDVNGTYGLIKSRSIATLTATWINHGEMLKCQATNDDSPGISINVTLDVKVPPKESSVSLSYAGNDLVPGGNLTVNQGEEHTLTCTVQGSRPAATIAVYRNGVIEETEDRTTEGDGLVNTTENWVFVPQRNYHKQRVKCEAKTNESTTPYPAADLTLVVDGPPDIPVISGSLTMVENVETRLTCTADLGYPDDWYLAWSNEGIPIENQPDTTAVISRTSERFLFISRLDFTPKRQDNTHFITCTASRASWTSTPEKTWGPVNVQYETNITNKHQSKVSIRGGLTANLTCIAKGNPAPIITWADPNNTDIINGGNDNKYMVVSYTISDAEMTVGDVTTSTLSIWAVDPQVDYGVYICNSNNNIGQPDSHEIIVNGTRRPNVPTGVVMTGRTSSSVAVRWSAGYDGGEVQWFYVSHEKTADSSETFSNRIDGGVTTYNVTGLESFTEYEIKVYAENDVGRNPSPGSILEYTLPGVPSSALGFTIEYSKSTGTVNIGGLRGNGECIQLEVKYEGILDWTDCGHCVGANREVMLSEQCPNNRNKRAASRDVDVRAMFCQMNGLVCSDSIGVQDVTKTDLSLQHCVSYAVFIGAVVSIVLLAVICIVVLVALLRRERRHQITEHGRPPSRESFLKERNKRCHDTTELDVLPTQPSSEELGHANLPSTSVEFPRDLGAPSLNI